MKGLWVALAALLLLGGCASKYRVDEASQSATLATSSGFYVMLPENGRYGATVYSQSGVILQQEVYGALLVHADRVAKATRVEDLGAACDAARQSGLDYVVEPTILHWEDRATQWSGRPDRITIRYAVYDAANQQKVASSVRRASSKWATLGGDHPQDLLPVPTREFVAALFGKPTAN